MDFLGVNFSFCLQHDASCRVIARLKKKETRLDNCFQRLKGSYLQLPKLPQRMPLLVMVNEVCVYIMPVHFLIRISWLFFQLSCNKIAMFKIAADGGEQGPDASWNFGWSYYRTDRL